MQIEHASLQSTTPDAIDDYENCFFICRFCNNARGKLPIINSQGGRLLNPCDVAWAEHFSASTGHIIPNSENESAVYTLEAYDFNDNRKVQLRQDREELIELAVRAMSKLPDLIRRLLEKASRTSDGESAKLFVESADELRSNLHEAKKVVERFRPVSADAPGRCRCGPRGPGDLPAFLANQCTEVIGE